MGMEYTNDAQKAIASAFAYADEKRHKYITPEHIAYGLCQTEEFTDVFSEFGGNIGLLKMELTSYIEKYAGTRDSVAKPVLTFDCRNVLEGAEARCISSAREKIEVSHLLGAIAELEDSYAAYYISKQAGSIMELVGEMSRRSHENKQPKKQAAKSLAGNTAEDTEENSNTEGFRSFTECLNDTWKEKNPLIGRKKELERTIQILCRKDKNNVLHIGEPGVGKTAITYGLAGMIEKGEVPDSLQGAKIYGIDMGTLVAGTQFRGDFEKRLKMIMEGISKEKNPIVYIDEIHNIVGAGAVNGGSLDASNMLKPYLAGGSIRFIGATTHEEYKKNLEGRGSLVRRFKNVEIAEPSDEECERIIEGLIKGYEDFHKVKYNKDVIKYAVEISRKYINERFLPDKAIDLIDEAGARRALEGGKKPVDKKLIDAILSETCNIPKKIVEKDDIAKIKDLEDKLALRIFGQEEAAKQVLNAIKFAKAGLNDENKPIASFLFVGATGVGKTALAKELADGLGIKLIRFDMSEYAQKHDAAKLIGSPAGYVGYEEGGLFTDEIRKNPHSVVLLDEIEKAHPDIFNVLLQVMDYATLTDNKGRKADFRNTIIIMTSNAGAANANKPGIGFSNNGGTNREAIDSAVKQAFSPEFRNRLSRIVIFNSMDEKMAAQITDKKLGELAGLLEPKKVELKFSKAAGEYIKKEGITNEYGARQIDRVITDKVKPLLADELLYGRLKNGGVCRLDFENGELFIRYNETEPEQKSKSKSKSAQPTKSAKAAKPRKAAKQAET